MSLKTLLLALAGLTATIIPARAATWGYLQSPFSPARQLRERLDFAAEERAELCRRYGRMPLDSYGHRVD